jgi:uncharacterized membrane protein YfcA
MNDMTFILVGLAAGILSGMFGVGGGIIIVPALVFMASFSQVTAAGTSLVALLLPVGLGGVLSYYNAGKIDGSHIRAGLIVAAGVFVGGFFGSKLALLMSEQLLKRLFAVLLLVVAVKTWLSAR